VYLKQPDRFELKLIVPLKLALLFPVWQESPVEKLGFLPFQLQAALRLESELLKNKIISRLKLKTLSSNCFISVWVD
jgi:hypothetical protein